MKAVVIHGARDLRVDPFEDALPPGPGEAQVAVANGGICGSDLHYYLHGGFGAIRVQQPMALGHEVSGVFPALGADVEGLRVGDKVAVEGWAETAEITAEQLQDLMAGGQELAELEGSLGGTV